MNNTSMKRSKNNENDFINEKQHDVKKLKITKAPEEKRMWKKIMLVNVVVTGTTNCDLHLNKLSKTLLNAEFFPKKFAALKLCRTHPFSKALIFRSGKIVCVGSTTIDGAFDSLNWFIEQINSVQDEKVFLIEKKVQNMVSCTQLKNETKSVNLQIVFDNTPGHVQYEPELARFVRFKLFLIYSLN